MDITRRKITKIAREVSRFTGRLFCHTGVGAAEYDLLNLVRKNPGITQKELSSMLGLNKSTVARQSASLMEKGFLTSTENSADGRSRLLYPTEKADSIKRSRAHTEAVFYEWLLGGLTESERMEFARMTDLLYARCLEESLSDFAHVRELLKNDSEEKR